MMIVINIVRNIKELFLVLIKIGNFYEEYNDDANMIFYLFG